MNICNHEFENENCTNCANGLPCSSYECAKTQGRLKEYCHKKAEEIHNKYYQQGRVDAIDAFKKYLLTHKKLVREFETNYVYESVKVEFITDTGIEELKEGE